MNGKQALARLRKVWGKGAEIHASREPSSPEMREKARSDRLAAKATKDECLRVLEARKEALLAADAEYQRLKADYTAAKDALDKLPSPFHYRYRAGTIGAGGLFFHVKAEGDNLEDLVVAAEAGKNRVN